MTKIGEPRVRSQSLARQEKTVVIVFSRSKKSRVANDTFGHRSTSTFADNMNFPSIDEYDLESKHFLFCILQKIDNVDDHKKTLVSSVEIVYLKKRLICNCK